DRLKTAYSSWEGTVSDLVGKTVIKLGFSLVVTAVAAAVGGLITASGIGALAGALLGAAASALISDVIDDIFDIKKAGDKFWEDAYDAHDKCSLHAYGKLTPFPSKSRIKDLMDVGKYFKILAAGR